MTKYTATLTDITPPFMRSMVDRNKEICALKEQGLSSSQILNQVGRFYEMGSDPLATIERIAFGRLS